MKTFKLMAFHLLNEEAIQPIHIIDGLTINLEDSHQTWVLELFIPNEYYSIFKTLEDNQTVFDAHAVISFPDNEPAPFSLIVSAITEIGDRLSVLLKGSIKARRQKYAEQLLQQLLEEGLSNDKLLQRFQHDMKERPKLNKQQ